MAAAGLVLVASGLIASPALAAHPEVSLPGSNFEIDTNANLKLDDPAPSIDWASVTETRKADKPTGATDDSFGQGTKEDTAVPTGLRQCVSEEPLVRFLHSGAEGLHRPGRGQHQQLRHGQRGQDRRRGRSGRTRPGQSAVPTGHRDS